MARFCNNCGSPLSDNARFCTACGAAAEIKTEPVEQTIAETIEAPVEVPVEEPAVVETPVEAPVVIPVQPPVVQESVEPVAAKAPRKINAGFGKTLLSVFLCLIAFILFTGAGIGLVTRLSLEKSSIKKTVDSLDVAKINISKFTGDTENKTVSKFLSAHKLSILSFEEKSLDKLLNEKFVKEFISSKTSAYANDVIKGTDKAEITVDDIVDLISDNWDKICDDLGLPVMIEYSGVKLAKKDIVSIFKKALNQSIGSNLEKVSMSEIKESNKFIFTIAQYALSYVCLGIAAGVAFVLLIIVVIMNIRYRGGFKYMGFTTLFAGLIILVLGIGMMSFLPGVLDGVVEIGKTTYKALFSRSYLFALIIGGATVVYGVVFVLIGSLLRKSFKRKYA